MSWARWITAARFEQHNRGRHKPRPQRLRRRGVRPFVRPWLEPLEERVVPAWTAIGSSPQQVLDSYQS
jgi:hypothetical protein